MADPNDWTRLFAQRRQRPEEPDEAQLEETLRAWAVRLLDDDETAEPKLDAELAELLTRIHRAG